MRMRAIAIGQDGEAELAITIAQAERPCILEHCRYARNSGRRLAPVPTMSTRNRRSHFPKTLHWTFELVILAGEHLLQCLIIDDRFPLKTPPFKLAINQLA